MPERMTSTDVVAINSSEQIVGVIHEISKQLPELDFFAASPVEKTSYKTLVRTELPTAGFRAINTGRDRDIGVVVARTVDCKYLDASWDADDQALTGVDWGDPVAELQQAHMLAQLKATQRQIWNGTSLDAAGFPGMDEMFLNADDDGVVDAGGAEANTGSSVYLIKTGVQDVCLAWGNDGRIDAGEIVEQQLYDGDGKPFMGKAQKVAGYVGLQITNLKSAVRICNLTEEAGATLDDDKVYAAIELFAERYGVEPDGMFMSHRSRRQLRDSRTATNPTGSAAPIPSEVGGIPLYATTGILNTEAILTDAA
ncbi:MAG: major capsid protein [Planctomycetota bacterium]